MDRFMLFLGFFSITVTVNLLSCYGNLDIVCMESEKQALLSFKHDLKVPSNRLSSWNASDDCCKWGGVVCDNSTGHVSELHLRNPYDDYESEAKYDDYESEAEYDVSKRSKLGGQINHSLLNLKHLSYLDLSQNDFGGIPIPSFIGSLVSLQYLNLSEAGFEGIVPHQLGNLSSLRFLSLKGFFLNVENLKWLSTLISLEHLDLSYVSLKKAPNWLQVINNLSSLVELHLSYCDLVHIPPLLNANFTSLAVLDISDNKFFSLIPSWIFSLSSLVTLDLGSTHFKGPIPNGFWNLTSLKTLDVSHNYLNSTLPNSLFGLNGLQSVDLHDTGFEGPIPIGLRNMTGLINLDLSVNRFNSILPNSLFGLNGLQSVDLRNNVFEGPIPIGLRNMTGLINLVLSENDFNSTIPDWLYSFSHLEMLDLHSNQLQGAISSAISNLTSAIILDLSFNELGGRVPKSMGNLCNLRALRLFENNIGGELSELLQSWSGCISNALVSLDLRGNQLSGHLTDQLVKFKNLRVLYLGGNSISGPILKSLGRLSKLEALNLARNRLNGTLPESLGDLSKLEQLAISDNLLEGVVSEAHFSNLTSLRELNADGNNLTLKVSPNWIPPLQLGSIKLRSWHLGPRFPMWLQSQKNLWELDLSQTGISDSIPYWFWSLTSQISYLNLSHNQIHGKIPDILKFDGTPPMLYLGSNQFTGPLPLLFSNVSELDLSNNSFSGDISHFLCEKKDMPNQLKILHLGENLLSGEIPDCWINWQSLEVVKLGNNNLTGNIPRSMGFLGGMRSLHLRNNSLSGDVPSSLQNCTQLWTVDLGWNHFVGQIPRWLGNSLSNLMVLNLRSNKFHGEIPSELCHLQYLQNLDLASNNLSGTIPLCFKNFTAMTTKHNSSNQISYSFYFGEFLENAFLVIKGREFQYNTILALVTSMDLSDNNISGGIPEELTSLLGLLSLNLSRNHLTGAIPKKIGDMDLLESIDFSRNQLSGEIPPSMSGLTFLSYLNLSYNNLSGRIPSSTQLQSLNASSFIGNELCGAPLTKNCSNDSNSGNEGDYESAKPGVDWFYLSMTLGFVLGFWGVCGPVLFNRPWRFAYFQFLDDIWHKFSVVVRKCI